MKRLLAGSLLSFIIFVFAIPVFAQKNKFISLFNEKNLNGWDTYLGPALDSTGKITGSEPVGLNNDPHHVFTVADLNGEKVIRISGSEWGGIATTNAFSDFHLQLQFKWGSQTWGQKRNKKRDSGLLYFANGNNGADYGAWMRSQEFQIEEGNCGDYWGVAGGMQDIPSTKNPDGNYVYDANGELNTFSATSATGRHCLKQGDAEHASGEWNMLDLYCNGDTSVHVINGKIMMVLYHSRQLVDGNVLPLSKGKIQIQSEGAEVFYKKIKVEPIQSIPFNLLK